MVIDMEKENYTLEAIVMKLIGEVYPIGETHEDDLRFVNLEKLTKLTDRLLSIIDEVAVNNKNRDEFSRKRVREHCCKFFDQIGIEE